MARQDIWRDSTWVLETNRGRSSSRTCTVLGRRIMVVEGVDPHGLVVAVELEQDPVQRPHRVAAVTNLPASEERGGDEPVKPMGT